MHIKNLATLATLVAAVVAAPGARHVVHEKREIVASGWARKDRVGSGLRVPVSIGLAQSNLDRGHDELMKVSDPESEHFGKHWTLEEITDFFAPSQESVDSVKEWLESAGIHPSRVSHSASRGWLKFEADVEELESLLKTQYHYYEHNRSGATHFATDEYSVPEHISKHIDIILPTVQFDSKIHYQTLNKDKKWERLQKRNVEAKPVVKSGHYPTGPYIGQPAPSAADIINPAAAQNNTCAEAITPACLRGLYNLPKGRLDLSSLGVVEYAQQTFRQQDLDNFFTTPALNDAGVPNGTHPIIKLIDGGSFSSVENFNTNGESDLDLEYAITLVYPQKVTLFQTGDNGTNYEDISFNNFLDALDASYCTYDGGDSPYYDESFPDPGGYQGPENCGTQKATAVISTSYGGDEAAVTQHYATRQCHEYMKLGMAGTSFLYSSGDDGVAGNGDQCGEGTNGQLFMPSFPGGCPYVTSVGATQLPLNASATGPEMACETVIFSGGGFSNYFALPSYQKAAVGQYYKNHAPPYTSAQYNNSQRVRGFPDVSANGAFYVIALDGEFAPVFGTSASTPTFASVITQINNERAVFGKGPLGFLNPSFYAFPGMFNDITKGGNQGCGTPGFTAVPGWDPVTGLGTPDFIKMTAVLASLP